MATGDTLLLLTPLHAAFPSVEPAYIANSSGASNRERPVIEFPQNSSVDTHADFLNLVMPSNYGGNGLDVILHFASVTDTSNDVKWNADIDNLDGGLIETVDFVGPNTIDGTFTAAKTEQTVVIPFTDGADMDNVTAGELFDLRITRDASDAGDTASGDVWLLAVELQET